MDLKLSPLFANWYFLSLYLLFQLLVSTLCRYKRNCMTGDTDGFFLMCEDLGRMFDNSFTACTFLNFEVEIGYTRYTSTPLARISPQWLSKLRQLLPSVP